MAKNLIKLICAVLVIAALVYVAVFGLGSLKGVFDGGIKQGLDLAGGTRLLYDPDVENKSKVEVSDLEIVESIMRSRLDGAGYNGANITIQRENKRIEIEIPAVSAIDDARKLLGDVGQLLFVNADGETVLTGEDIKGAEAVYGQPSESSITSQWYVTIELTDAARTKFAAATKAAAARASEGANFIVIMLDNAIVSMPYCSGEIDSTSVMITNPDGFEEEQARYLSSVISSGQLPFSLKEVSGEAVGATLGEKSLETSLYAGAIGILLVMLFMLIIYRLNGLVADIALVCYTAIVGIVLVIAKVDLTLPGIAGIILSIGMAVDANVVIFERIREELALGKTAQSAVKSGFKRAFTAIIDSNITTIIASVVLWIFGSGTVVGFAKTLFIGIVVSMFTAIVVTRFLLEAIVGLGAKNPKLYGM